MQKVELGFYYHYKHNPEKGFNDYAYEVLGVALHTEKEKDDNDAYTVIYKPLHQAEHLAERATLYARPLAMFLEYVMKENGERVERFQKIRDTEIIEKLQKWRG